MELVRPQLALLFPEPPRSRKTAENPISGQGEPPTGNMRQTLRELLPAGLRQERRTYGAGMNGLALQVQQALNRDPHAGDVYVFRGRRGDLLKILWHDGLGMSLYAKRLERGRFISYGLCQPFWACAADSPAGRRVIGWTRSAGVRTPGSRDGRSDSYAEVGYPMMTVGRRAASLWPRTWASLPVQHEFEGSLYAPNVLADADHEMCGAVASAEVVEFCCS
jgi:hypothetical protein